MPAKPYSIPCIPEGVDASTSPTGRGFKVRLHSKPNVELEDDDDDGIESSVSLSPDKLFDFCRIHFAFPSTITSLVHVAGPRTCHLFDNTNILSETSTFDPEEIDSRGSWNASKELDQNQNLLFPNYRNERIKLIERIERSNQELSHRCENLQSEIQTMEHELGFFQTNTQVTIQSFQEQLEILTQEKQLLLKECNILAQKLADVTQSNRGCHVCDDVCCCRERSR